MSYRNPLIYGLLCLFLLNPAYSLAQTAFEYSLIIDEKPIGAMAITRQNQPNGHYLVTQISHINISSFWGDVKLNGTLTETHDMHEGLLQSSNKLKDNDKTYWTKIERSGNEFLAFKSELTNDQQKEDAETVDFAKGVVAHLVPGAGNVMMIGELLLSDDKNQPKNNRFTNDSFDSSFLNIPYLWQKSAYTLPETLRIFDTEELYIFSANITDLGEKSLDINGFSIKARQYQLEIKDAEPINMWLAIHDNGAPYFAQIAGKDEDGTYKIILDKGR